MEINQHILERYFAGTASAEEQAQVELYLQQTSTPGLDHFLLQTWHKANPETPVVPIHNKQPKKAWFYGAAAAAVTAIVGMFAWHAQKELPQQPLAQAFDTLYNAQPNVKTVIMPDGSKVWLNRHATLVYATNYNEQKRELWLQGEAYFEVAQNSQLPFKVHAGGVITTALGTSFNIATGNKADGSVQISLLSGKVGISLMDSSSHNYLRVLAPGEMLSFKQGSLLAHATQFNEEEVMDWKNGKLLFEKNTLADVLAKLQGRYGVNIQLNDESLIHRKVSGKFSSSVSLEHVLKSLQFVHQFNYQRTTNGTYIITSIKK
ncbi:FecR family protein [Chitinophaga skermanii]|nr:FecR domain-containing protein [Chitinophaga skermanii]